MSRVALTALAIAGVLALAACTEQEPDITLDDQVPADQREDAAPADDNGAPAEDGDVAETISVEAGDLFFEGIPDTLPAGTIQIEFENVGNLPHDIVVEEAGNEKVVEADGGGSDSGTITLEPGEYTLYCDVPGHRAQMEETVTVE